MRVSVLVLIASTNMIHAGETKAESRATPLDRCVKILKFGQLNEYFEPGKEQAVVALGLLGDERAVPVLTEHLANEKNAHLRVLIVRSLGWIKSKKAIPALEKAYEDADYHIKKGAALALEQITGKAYEVGEPPPLKDILSKLGGFDRKLRPKSFLETGKTYRFGLPRRDEFLAKVLEAPEENWVKLQTGQGDLQLVFWVNLATVETVTVISERK